MIEVVLAPNPSLYTGPGTNTYLLSSGSEVLIVDPGPVIDTHAAAIIAAVGERTAVGVVVTHTHPDHAPLANPLAMTLGVPVFGFGPGPEFIPNVPLADGSTVPFGANEIIAVHTPGHTADHLCFRLGATLLTGDHIMEGSSVIIEDAAAYLDSLYRVRDLGVERLEPGHGTGIDDAGKAIADYIDHRNERELQIVAAVTDGAGTVGDIVDVVYAGIPAGLRRAAVHQVGVQLTKLSRDGAISFVSGAAEEETEVRPS
ncbi:MAG: MBL fold metallo-hydrolase [Acidimicrobiia bacterium]|nr:MAG: MBL fold metallo-hydrolase [Acidimicrobiia bacterium]